MGLDGNVGEREPGRREDGGGGVRKACGRDGKGEKGEEGKWERKSAPQLQPAVATATASYSQLHQLQLDRNFCVTKP